MHLRLRLRRGGKKVADEWTESYFLLGKSLLETSLRKRDILTDDCNCFLQSMLNVP